MKCPKDADETEDEDMCNVTNNDDYCCTRKKGHKGKHHAHTAEGMCCIVWDNNEN